MNINLDIELQAKLNRMIKHHPIPWTLDFANADGACVKDDRGDVVFQVYYPDMKGVAHAKEVKTDLVAKSHAVAHFLVELSTRTFHPHQFRNPGDGQK